MISLMKVCSAKRKEAGKGHGDRLDKCPDASAGSQGSAPQHEAVRGLAWYCHASQACSHLADYLRICIQET